MAGFTAGNNLYHKDEECPLAHGKLREVTTTKALKWGLKYCPVCTDRGAKNAARHSQ